MHQVSRLLRLCGSIRCGRMSALPRVSGSSAVPTNPGGIDMANSANVDTQAMAAASVIFTDHIGTHRTTHGSIGNEVQVLASRWTGEASTVFVTSTMRQWLDVYQKVIGRLEAMKQSLDDNSGLYARTHEQTVETAGSPLPGLPGI